MKGDFTRDTFNSASHFTRVLMQQGRVQLDADWNEQAAILLHYLQALAADVIGPHGGPQQDYGFAIQGDGKDMTIGKGHYYVDGILCENEADCRYTNQPDYPLPADHSLDLNKLLADGAGNVVYLDVWERHLISLDDERIREVALGGPDTATRAKVVWQVKVMQAETCDAAYETLRASADLERRAKLKVQLDPGSVNTDPCIQAPDSLYRGAENQLYRVEIHQVNTNADGKIQSWSFKWSRDNGAITTAWLGADEEGGQIVGSARGFAAENWVEVTSEFEELNSIPGKLYQIANVEGGAFTFNPPLDIEWDKDIPRKIRRWDQSEVGDVVLQDGAVPGETGKWLDLEDGIQVWFDTNGDFRPGDYWMFPARVATGQIEWPQEPGPKNAMVPSLVAPRGIQHHYAPLATLTWNGKSLGESDAADCRSPFISLVELLAILKAAKG